METINLTEKFALFDDTWSPKIIGELNENYVKLAKIEGEFVWHKHDEEDELFIVIEGEMRMEYRDRTEQVGPGEIIIVPRGVEHRPVAHGPVQIMLIEPKTVVNTGNVISERTVTDEEWI